LITTTESGLDCGPAGLATVSIATPTSSRSTKSTAPLSFAVTLLAQKPERDNWQDHELENRPQDPIGPETIRDVFTSVRRE
jgi:hypothetical protein